MVLSHLGATGHTLSVLLCDDPTIRDLNRTYREKDKTTDVLSFPMDGPDGPLLGDIAVSTDTAKRQADERGHSLAIELRVLLVHGLLHLRGHDHHNKADRDRMVKAERECLRVLGIGSETLVGRAGGADSERDD